MLNERTSENDTKMVSIIIPAHNAEKWIERSVQSALRQSYHNVEVIVVENGSTDETWDVISGIVDSRLVILKSEKGVSNARNMGIDYAKGEFLTFLDADDWLVSEAVEIMMYYMDQDVDIVSARYYGDKPFEKYEYRKYKTGDEKYLLKCLCAPTKRGNSTGNLYRREFIRKHEIRFDPILSHAEDSVFFFEILMKKPVVVDIEKPVYYVFANPDSVTRGNLDRNDFCLATEKIYELLLDKDCVIKNAGYIFALNQVLVIIVHSGKKGKDQSDYIKDVCSEDVFRKAVQNVDVKNVGMIQKILFIFMKKKCYLFLSVATTMRAFQNSRRKKNK